MSGYPAKVFQNMIFSAFHRILLLLRNIGLMSVLSVTVGGCATLPSSGPTGAQITDAFRDPASGAEIRYVELEQLSDVPAQPASPEVFAPDYSPPPTDLIAAGDVVDVIVYETGVALFGGSPGGVVSTVTGLDPSATSEKLTAIRVDDAGFVRLPYLGQVRAAGRTTAELAAVLRSSYRGMSQNPQVLVTMREVIGNSVLIGGDVVRPGRLVLPTNRETLSDAIALAGGYRGEAKDISVRVQRQDQSVEIRLSDVMKTSANDMRVFPGDKISVLRAPRNFSVMGAPGRVEQLPFSGPSISLSEAIATAGGVNPNLGDPEAVFVFRFEKNAEGVEEPVVYHVNMAKGGAFFVAQRFAMLDKDVLYIGNARANQPSKMIQIISQLFAPIVTVRDIARSTGN